MGQARAWTTTFIYPQRHAPAMRMPILAVLLLIVAGCATPSAPPPDDTPIPAAPAHLTGIEYACAPGLTPKPPFDVCASYQPSPTRGRGLMKMLVSPLDPKTVVAAVYENAVPDNAPDFAPQHRIPTLVSYLEVSHDEGLTWARMDLPVIPTPDAAADVISEEDVLAADIVFDSKGTLHVLGSASRAEALASESGSIFGFRPSGGGAYYLFHVATEDLGATWSQVQVIEELKGDQRQLHVGYYEGWFLVVWPRAGGESLAAMTSRDGVGWANFTGAAPYCSILTNLVIRGDGLAAACFDNDAMSVITWSPGDSDILKGPGVDVPSPLLIPAGLAVSPSGDLAFFMFPALVFVYHADEWTGPLDLLAGCTVCDDAGTDSAVAGVAFDSVGTLHILFGITVNDPACPPPSVTNCPAARMIHEALTFPEVVVVQSVLLLHVGSPDFGYGTNSAAVGYLGNSASMLVGDTYGVSAPWTFSDFGLARFDLNITT